MNKDLARKNGTLCQLRQRAYKDAKKPSLVAEYYKSKAKRVFLCK